MWVRILGCNHGIIEYIHYICICQNTWGATAKSIQFVVLKPFFVTCGIEFPLIKEKHIIGKMPFWLWLAWCEQKIWNNCMTLLWKFQVNTHMPSEISMYFKVEFVYIYNVNNWDIIFWIIRDKHNSRVIPYIILHQVSFMCNCDNLCVLEYKLQATIHLLE